MERDELFSFAGGLLDIVDTYVNLDTSYNEIEAMIASAINDHFQLGVEITDEEQGL